MITRNSESRFTPDLCSRVTFVNFTVTPASLQNQCLMIYLRSERPDVEKKRIKLLKLQGEFIVKLRGFEDDLLDKLNNVKGSILEDEDAIQTLESLKKEAAIVTKEMKESGMVLEEVERTTEQYQDLAHVSASIYFALQNMSGVYSFYQFSLRFFMNIVRQVLTNNATLKELPTDQYGERIVCIRSCLFLDTYHKVFHALLNKDKLTFALKMAQINSGGEMGEIFDALLKPTTIIKSSLSHNTLGGKLTDNQLKSLEEISKSAPFKGLLSSLNNNDSEWLTFLADEKLMDVPTGWENEDTLEKVSGAMRDQARLLMQIAVANVVRPD